MSAGAVLLMSTQVASAFFELVEGQNNFRSFGPIAGPGTIVEFGFLAGFVLDGFFEVAVVLSGSDSATVGNLQAGVPLLGRSDVRVNGVSAFRLRLGDTDSVFVAVPMSIRFASGPWFVVLGKNQNVAGTGRLSFLCWVKVESVVREFARSSGSVLEDLRRGASEARAAAPSA